MMIKRGLLLFFIPVLIFSNCSRNRKEWLIPDKKLVKILADIHIADAIIQSREFNMRFKHSDSLYYYNVILDKYGVSRASFDSTIHWYAGYPAKYDKLYEKVLIEITRMQDKLDAMDSLGKRKPNFEAGLWNQKKDWILPDDGNRESITFDIPITRTGRFSISANIRLNTNDQSLNPRLTAYFWKNDGSSEGVRDTFTSVPLEKNGILKLYSISKILNDKTFTHLRGSILSHDPQDGRWKKDAEVRNIRVLFQAQFTE